jgi:hypothetical protein
MRSVKHIVLLAFVLACVFSAFATFGFLVRSDATAIVGAPGFVLGGMLTGGHRTTLAATAISGTIINFGLYFMVFLALLGLIKLFRRKT